MKDVTPVIIVGAGQAGICLSYFLQQAGIEHVVLEKDRGFSAWYNRWDSFRMNTANFMNRLPGLNKDMTVDGDYDLASKQDALKYFESYLLHANPPMLTGHKVLTIEQDAHKPCWRVQTNQTAFYASQVVLCTGVGQARLPPIAERIPHWVEQIHSSDYRRPSQIKTNKVLVVGSGSSGVQICYDLFLNNKFTEIILSKGNNARFPWRLFGLPIHFWARVLRLFEIKRHSKLGTWMYQRAQGHGDPAAPPSPGFLNKLETVSVYGRLLDLQNEHLIFANGEQMSLDDLSIVWCTGFQYDFRLIKGLCPSLDLGDEPRHIRGVSRDFAGLYFLGLRFQHSLGSHILYGIGKDAEYICNQIRNRLFTDV